MSIDDTFGCMLIGVITASALWGLTAIQTWYYYTHYPKDSKTIKFLVAVVLISDTCHQALISHLIYTYLVTYFGNLDAIQNIVWSLIIEAVFNGITTLLVQCFMVWRIYKLSDGNMLAVASALAWVVSGFVLTMLWCAKGIYIQTFVELPQIKGISMTVNGLSAAGDLYIAGVLYYFLQKSKTGFQRSDTIVSKLIVFTINTGVLTSICALCSLITYAVFPNAMIYIAFYYNIGRLYCNSLMATLNARKAMRHHDDENGTSISSHNAHMLSSTMTRHQTRHAAANSISVKIDTTREKFVAGDGSPMSAASDVKVAESV